MKEQTYVECLTPFGGARREFPLIFVHGGGQSGMVGKENNELCRVALSLRSELASDPGRSKRLGLLFP